VVAQAAQLRHHRVHQHLCAWRHPGQRRPGGTEEGEHLRLRGQPVVVPELVGDLEADGARGLGELRNALDGLPKRARPVEPSGDQVDLEPDLRASGAQPFRRTEVRVGRGDLDQGRRAGLPGFCAPGRKW
jgi:hypothetical protein